MTTVTLPTVPPPPRSRDGAGRRLPLPGRYTVAPGRSLAELTVWYGPLPVLRRRVTLGGTSLTVPEDTERPRSATTSTTACFPPRSFPVPLRLRVVERAGIVAGVAVLRLLLVGSRASAPQASGARRAPGEEET
ncbi:hypothetical protein ACIP6X_18530 [Streptomyces coeruleorubidus]|uniref:hypothetical protein n=1 Tax=Streptomyces coeruleorubidus TaxID=116188 RepID=UPI003826FB5C